MRLFLLPVGPAQNWGNLDSKEESRLIGKICCYSNYIRIVMFSWCSEHF